MEASCTCREKGKISRMAVALDCVYRAPLILLINLIAGAFLGLLQPSQEAEIIGAVVAIWAFFTFMVSPGGIHVAYVGNQWEKEHTFLLVIGLLVNIGTAVAVFVIHSLIGSPIDYSA